ncbi:uncharacterized protein LOC133744253 [Rosa rugosa]|uniref:uncharacterized protein LOC133744253 n=1 Tax=Rosa rugosa TaxID=74645 RepID=UPI002B4022DB|nr:uncharacterized protein LOC133744253 [Rosa rugosa]
MDRDRERSGSINCPPFFDGNDYSQWKIMMQAFLHSQDEHIWNIVELGWEVPTKETKSKESESSASIKEPKSRQDWSIAEVRDFNNDVKARHSLYTALSMKEKKRIGTCKTAKKAWDLLQMTYEGNKKVRTQKLQKLISEFETMTMGDDESIDDFHSRLINVTNECDSLGDPIAENRIVKKFLRSLPLSFQNKQTAIEEVQDLDTYTLDELLGNLQTFEMKIRPDKKVKTIALNAVRKVDEKPKELVKEKDSDSDFTAEDFALLTKHYKKFLRSGNSFQNSKNFSGSSSRRNMSGDYSSEKDTKARFTYKKPSVDKPKCFECQGFGHLAADCGNKRFKAHSNKAMNTTWSDSESDTQSECGEDNVALTAALHPSSSCEYEEKDLDDEETNDQAMADKYQEMCRASTKMLKLNQSLSEKLCLVEQEKEGIAKHLQSCTKNWEIEKSVYVGRIKSLQDNLDTQISLVNSLSSEKLSLELSLKESQEKFLKFSISSDKVSKMIGIGKVGGDKKGIGFSDSTSFKDSKPIRSSGTRRYVGIR